MLGAAIPSVPLTAEHQFLVAAELGAVGGHLACSALGLSERRNATDETLLISKHLREINGLKHPELPKVKNQ